MKKSVLTLIMFIIVAATYDASGCNITPVIYAGGPTTFCNGGNVSLSTDIYVSYLWSTGETTQNITVTTAGNYTVYVIDINGCTGTSAVMVVTVITAPLQVSFIGPNPVCAGSTVTYTDSISNNTGTSFVWTLPNGWTGTSTTNSITTVVGISGGNISVVASNQCGSSAPPINTTFNYTGAVESWTVPAGVTSITVQANGASGGSAGIYAGGLGASITGTFVVSPNQILTIAVGGQGIYNGTTSGGGGGGSGVYYNTTPLAIAGAGGGASGQGAENGQDGNISLNGSNSSGAGGTNGLGGDVGYIIGDCGYGGGGGGFMGDGYGGGGPIGILGGPAAGLSIANGGNAGVGGSCGFNLMVNGGWGCGGGGRSEYGGGGGGGYSGGGGGEYVDVIGKKGGGGGGSYNGGTNQTNITGANYGDGYVIITSSSPVNIVVNNNAPAQPGNITGNVNVCQGTVQTYSISADSTATSYIWTIPNGWVGSSTTTSITTTVGSSSGTISVTANNSCGSGGIQTLFVAVDTAPATPGPLTLDSINGSVVGINWPTDSGAWQYSIRISSDSLNAWTNYYINALATSYTFTGLSFYTHYDVCISAVNQCFNQSGWDCINFFTSDNCYTSFNLFPDTSIQHHYFITDSISGIPPYQYLWSWGDSTYDTIPYPSHTYTDSGFYTICLTLTDSTGCQSTYCDSSYHIMRNTNQMVYVNVIPSILTSTNATNVNNEISVYPNPATSILTIHQTVIPIKEESLIITNILGEEIYHQLITGTQSTIDISNWSNGVYFYQIRNDKETLEGKFVVEK